LNGHHWAQQQLRQAGIAFEALDNGFRWCENPAHLQAVCDTLGPNDVQAFFDRWVERLPWPLTSVDRAAGFRHRLSLWQVEVSLTQIFQEPVYGRRWFEAILRENLDLGRPDRVSLLFPTRLTRATPPPKRGYRTRVVTAGVMPTLHVSFKHSDLKQYFKGCGIRTETTFNDPTDVQRTKGLETLPHLREVGRRINQRLLETERLSHSFAVPTPLVDRIQQPLGTGSRHVAGLRLSDPRVLALLQALCSFSHLPLGFRNRDLRPQVAQLLGWELARYSPGAMTYDLRRLRLHGLIQRVPHLPLRRHAGRPATCVRGQSDLPPPAPAGLVGLRRLHQRSSRTAAEGPRATRRRPPTPRGSVRLSFSEPASRSLKLDSSLTLPPH